MFDFILSWFHSTGGAYGYTVCIIFTLGELLITQLYPFNWNLELPQYDYNAEMHSQAYVNYTIVFPNSHPSPTVMRFRERESAPQVKLQPYRGDFILGYGLPSNDTQVPIAISLPCPPLTCLCLSSEFQWLVKFARKYSNEQIKHLHSAS